ncbi:MAG: SDR family oxidoreductase [Burkholderiales bacterium]
MESSALKGRSILITGASAGIGRATALAMARAGANILATGRRAEALEAVAKQCASSGNVIRVLAGDLESPAFVEKLVETAGEVDILVNNAGVLTYAPILDMRAAECQAMFNTNVLAAFAVAQAVAKKMAARKSGHIIFVTSTAAREVYKLGGIYCASKHALSAIARSLRLELQASGVRVSEVAPGMVDTNIRDGSTHPATQAALAARTISPLTAEEVADAIVYTAVTPANCCADLIELRPRGAAIG